MALRMPSNEMPGVQSTVKGLLSKGVDEERALPLQHGRTVAMGAQGMKLGFEFNARCSVFKE
ncbi:hypothetical protein HK44_015935 [Pseudomonas fluorescens HK44]|uniref:Uncharacterized protein n=1 Tax=Pseudomonas fluorescens HK44 TaxID=1042209 RepID=A0A010S876_PSEFL|nr:hypothetical protein HK44_015935 [Pseudomonas fluorescens HK44]